MVNFISQYLIHIYIYGYVYTWIYTYMHYVYIYVDICIQIHMKHPGPPPWNVLGCPLWHIADRSSWVRLVLYNLFRPTSSALTLRDISWMVWDQGLKVGPLDSSATTELHSMPHWQQKAGVAGTHAALRKWVFVFPSRCQNKPEGFIPKRNLSEETDSVTGRKV